MLGTLEHTTHWCRMYGRTHTVTLHTISVTGISVAEVQAELVRFRTAFILFRDLSWDAFVADPLSPTRARVLA